MSDKLTDEQLREMADKGTVQWRAEVSSMATELLALRAERAKPTQSMTADEADEVDELIDKIKGVSYPETFQLILAAFASIRAEGSAERAKLEAALRRLSNEVLGALPLMEPLFRQELGNTNYNLLIQRAEEGQSLLAQPAEGGARERQGRRVTDPVEQTPFGYYDAAGSWHHTGAKP